MRAVAIVVFIIGLLMAGGGAYYASRFISAYEDALAHNQLKGVETRKIVVAQRDIPFGHVIKQEDLALADFPSALVPEGAFEDWGDVWGADGRKRTAVQSMRRGEAILASKISLPGQSPRLAHNLAEGKRAFSFPINASSGVAGFVQAGDRVDIILTRHERGQGVMISEVFMQDVLVIAVDQRARQEGSKARVGRIATVEVDPLDAQKLQLAQASGTLSLTLRGIEEETTRTEQLQPVTTQDLFATEEEAEPEPIERTKVRVNRGGRVEHFTFE